MRSELPDSLIFMDNIKKVGFYEKTTAGLKELYSLEIKITGKSYAKKMKFSKTNFANTQSIESFNCKKSNYILEIKDSNKIDNNRELLIFSQIGIENLNLPKAEIDNLNKYY